jgi:hypothetical protein
MKETFRSHPTRVRVGVKTVIHFEAFSPHWYIYDQHAVDTMYHKLDSSQS